MFGLDSPEPLFKLMIDDMADTYNTQDTKIDAVFYQGDFVIHGLSSANSNINNWSTMKPLIET